MSEMIFEEMFMCDHKFNVVEYSKETMKIECKICTETQTLLKDIKKGTWIVQEIGNR